ncbi:hypothetical protein GCM10027610_104140 [Dactylosporangium cerinum]
MIYQVYPRSFADADGDGMGDLRGITSRLDHLAELGVDALWMSPFYPSPQHDAGYDVADYRDVDPRFGTLDDFDALVTAAKARNLRVVVDLVPNHTSSDHAWFLEAIKAGPGSSERERYHFRKGLGPDGELPPNGWQSVFGGPAWTRVPDGEWYLHLFDSSQPDLNWDLPEVRQMFIDVLRFWLDRGVDGFRVDVAHGLIKESGLPDWTEAQVPITSPGAEHRTPPMWDQDGVHDIYREWRRVLDSYEGDRMMVGEAWVSPAERMARYIRPDEMHQAFNFSYLMAPWTATDQRAAIIESIEGVAPVGAVCTWVLSNHDVVRHASRLGYEPGYSTQGGIGVDDPQPDEALGLRRARAATMLMLSLPGSAYLYQGRSSACRSTPRCPTTSGRIRPGSGPSMRYGAATAAACRCRGRPPHRRSASGRVSRACPRRGSRSPPTGDASPPTPSAACPARPCRSTPRRCACAGPTSWAAASCSGGPAKVRSWSTSATAGSG